MKQFKDISHEAQNLSGTKIAIANIFDKPIILQAYRIIKSKVINNKDCAQLQFLLDGVQYITFTTSAVLVRQAQEYGHECPFEVIIKRVGRYHTFT